MHLFYPQYGLATTTRYGCTTVVPLRSHQHRSRYSTFSAVRLSTPSFHFPTFHTCPSVSARYHQHHSCSIHGVISPTSWLCYLRCGSNTTFLKWNAVSVHSLLTNTTCFSIVGSVYHHQGYPTSGVVMDLLILVLHFCFNLVSPTSQLFHPLE